MTTTHAIASFEDLVDLANERLGGAAVVCSDDFFAGMENLVKAKEPVWDEDAYTDRGKWMDGWESRRSHRENSGARDGEWHEDFCVVRLGAPGVIRGVVVDTAFFRGNFPSHCALEGTSVDGYPSAQEIAKHAEWFPLLPRSPLLGNAKNDFAVSSPYRFTHVRLRIFPDGGVARLRVYGEPLPDFRLHGGLDGELEVSGAELGGVVLACSDMFFGSRHNLLFPGHSGGMHDGWETRRARRAGYDWAVVKLGARSTPTRLVVDTSHFKGNCPESFAVDAGSSADGEWRELFPRTQLRPHTRHVFPLSGAQPAVSHVRLRVHPDGGVARFRVFARVDDDERAALRVKRLNAMPPAEAEAAFLSCCGSCTWAKKMLAARPFLAPSALDESVRAAFNALVTDDWLEAFAAHPRIGGGAAAAATAASRAWSDDEQRAVGGAVDDVKARLAAQNDAYFAKHGFIFIVMASGKSAAEMLAILEERVKNDRDAEIKNAAEEQKRITALRLARLA